MFVRLRSPLFSRLVLTEILRSLRRCLFSSRGCLCCMGAEGLLLPSPLNQTREEERVHSNLPVCSLSVPAHAHEPTSVDGSQTDSRVIFFFFVFFVEQLALSPLGVSVSCCLFWRRERCTPLSPRNLRLGPSCFASLSHTATRGVLGRLRETFKFRLGPRFVRNCQAVPCNGGRQHAPGEVSGDWEGGGGGGGRGWLLSRVGVWSCLWTDVPVWVCSMRLQLTAFQVTMVCYVFCEGRV